MLILMIMVNSALPSLPVSHNDSLTFIPKVKTFDDYNAFLPAKGVKPGHIFDRFMPPADARKKLEQVKGHLVWMPLDFLKDADMAERGLQVNSWTESVYT